MNVTEKDLKSFLLNKTQIKTIGKQDYIYCEINEVGIQLEESLQSAVLSSLKSLPISKVMTYQRLSERWFWKSMWDDTHNFVRSCRTCIANKTSNQQPMGEARPLPLPSKP